MARISPQASAAVIAILTLVLASLFACALYWSYRQSGRYPKGPRLTSGVQLQRYGPAIYACIFVCALIGFAISTWLLIQYNSNHKYPNVQSKNGIRFLLFCACWTAPTAALHSISLLHPVWSKHRISSIGSHSLWVFLTWIFWVAGAGALNASLPTLLTGGSCWGLNMYCTQLQALFAFAVLNILILTGGMLVMAWHAWQTLR